MGKLGFLYKIKYVKYIQIINKKSQCDLHKSKTYRTTFKLPLCIQNNLCFIYTGIFTVIGIDTTKLSDIHRVEYKQTKL